MVTKKTGAVYFIRLSLSFLRLVKKSIFLSALFLLVSAITTFFYHYSQKAEINYRYAHRMFLKGDFLKAIPFYEKALALNISYPSAVTELAYCYKWSGYNEKAIDAFRQALKLNPRDKKLKSELAESLSWSGRFDEALGLYNEILSETKDPRVNLKIAELYLWSGQPQKAEDILRPMVEVGQVFPGTLLLFAKSLLYSGKFKDALELYDQIKEDQIFKNDTKTRLLYAEAFLYSGKFPEADRIFSELIQEDPKNLNAMEYRADIHAYKNEYKDAIDKYRMLLKLEENPRVKRKLADVLSWDRKYKEAITLYDELLKDNQDEKIMLQKARVLGWWRKYPESIQEYRKILKKKYDDRVNLEMQAKIYYWNNRVERAIRYLQLLIDDDPKNAEAMFDLAQIYSQQAMWEEAIKIYKKILAVYPEHFRAKEGLRKTEIILKQPSLVSGLEFLEADSLTRDSDIRKNIFFNVLQINFNQHLTFEPSYKFARRFFADYTALSENETSCRLIFRKAPFWSVDAFYRLFAYNRGLASLHNFGTAWTARILDTGVLGFSYERQRLENNSLVIRRHYYSDNYKERILLDFNNRFKMELGYLFSRYSDSNYKNEPSAEFTYYFMLEPRSLSLKYKFAYSDYRMQVLEYFSPSGFYTNTIGLSWKHFLNKKEIFFGADDTWYELGYEISLDSEDIATHKFILGFIRDINKRLNFGIKMHAVDSSADVYKEKNIVISLKSYF